MRREIDLFKQGQAVASAADASGAGRRDRHGGVVPVKGSRPAEVDDDGSLGPADEVDGPTTASRRRKVFDPLGSKVSRPGRLPASALNLLVHKCLDEMINTPGGTFEYERRCVIACP